MKVHVEGDLYFKTFQNGEDLGVRLLDWGIGAYDKEYYEQEKTVYRYWLPPEEGGMHTVIDRPYRAARAGLFATMVQTTGGKEK